MLFALNWTHRDRDCVDLACKEYPIWISSKIMLGWDGMSKEIFVSLNIYSFLLYTLTLHAGFLCMCMQHDIVRRKLKMGKIGKKERGMILSSNELR